MRIVRSAASGEGVAIRYPAAILASSPDTVRAAELLGLLSGVHGATILVRHGFLPRLAAPDGARFPRIEEPEGSGILAAVRVSLTVAAAAVLIDLLPALALAWILARKRFFGRGGGLCGTASRDHRIRLVAVCDLDIKTHVKRGLLKPYADRGVPLEKVYDDFDVFLAHDMDAVVVATPPAPQEKHL